MFTILCSHLPNWFLFSPWLNLAFTALMALCNASWLFNTPDVRISFNHLIRCLRLSLKYCVCVFVCLFILAQSTILTTVPDNLMVKICTTLSVQLASHVQLFVTPWIAASQASLSITNSQSLLKLMSIEPVMPSKNLILCHPLLLLPSIFPSVRVFSNELILHIRWPKYWSFSFSVSPSDEYSELISFRIYWLDLLAVKGTLKSLLQHRSSKASILQCSAFVIVQLSHAYMTTGRNIALAT